MGQLIYNRWLCSFHSALCPVFMSNFTFYLNVIKYKGFLNIFSQTKFLLHTTMKAYNSQCLRAIFKGENKILNHFYIVGVPSPKQSRQGN